MYKIIEKCLPLVKKSPSFFLSKDNSFTHLSDIILSILSTSF